MNDDIKARLRDYLCPIEHQCGGGSVDDECVSCDAADLIERLIQAIKDHHDTRDDEFFDLTKHACECMFLICEQDVALVREAENAPQYAQCLARDGGGAEDERCILHVLNHPIGHVFPSRIRTLATMWEEGELIERETAPSSVTSSLTVEEAKERVVVLAVERHDHGGTCDRCYFVGARGGPRTHCKEMKRIDGEMVRAVCELTCWREKVQP